MAENIWRGWDGFYTSELVTVGGLRFWQDQGEHFSPAFRDYVIAIVALQQGAQPSAAAHEGEHRLGDR